MVDAAQRDHRCAAGRGREAVSSALWIQYARRRGRSRTDSSSAADGQTETTRRQQVRAVRFTNPQGEVRIGALEDDTVRDAGPAGPHGFVPTDEAWAQLDSADGPEHDVSDVTLLHPVVPEKILAIGLNYRSHAAESELDVPTVPVVFAKWTSSLIGPGRGHRHPARGDAPRLRGRGGGRHRPAHLPGHAGERARGDRRDLGRARRLGPARAARDAAAPVHARQEL